MHFAIVIPDWNSLDSVRRAHSELEAMALVFFALLVLFDVLAHFSEDKKREKLLEKIGLCFFAVAVFAEITAYPYGQRNDTLSAQIIGSLDVKAQSALRRSDLAEGKAGDAEIKSEKAEEKSGNALTRAENAEKSLGRAESEAKSAQTASSNALDLARGARQEADSFERDIVAAKQAAAAAEEKLADRELTDEQIQRLAQKLVEFAGQEYTVTAYWDSPETSRIANRVHAALQLAHWSYFTEGSKSMLLGGIVGIVINMHPDADESTKRAAESLVEALHQERLEAKIKMQNPQNNPKHNKLWLNVGAKR